jgi:dGTPase
MTIEICEKYRSSTQSPQLSPWEQLHFCDLVEAIGLAHDWGHPPFAHIGEVKLNKMLCGYGNIGFEANAQSLRILTKLDKAYPNRPGFTRGILAGVMKYKIKRSTALAKGLDKFIYDDDWEIVELSCPWWRHDEALCSSTDVHSFQKAVKESRTLPCQIVDLADEVTYAGHDIEDALYTPLLGPGSIASVDTVAEHIKQEGIQRIQSETEFVSGVPLEETMLQGGWEQLRFRLLKIFSSASLSELRSLAHQIRREHMNSACATCRAECIEGKWHVRISQDSALRSALIRHVIVPLVHHDSRLVTLQRKGCRVIESLFKEVMNDGEELLPWDYRNEFVSTREANAKARICCDFIASMTEEYALRFYQRLFESDRGVLTDFF